jgi:hypothetical protein
LDINFLRLNLCDLSAYINNNLNKIANNIPFVETGAGVMSSIARPYTISLRPIEVTQFERSIGAAAWLEHLAKEKRSEKVRRALAASAEAHTLRPRDRQKSISSRSQQNIIGDRTSAKTTLQTQAFHRPAIRPRGAAGFEGGSRGIGDRASRW